MNYKTYSTGELLIRSNWDDEPSGYAGNQDNLIFHWKYATLLVWNGKKILQTVFLGYIFVYAQIKH